MQAKHLALSISLAIAASAVQAAEESKDWGIEEVVVTAQKREQSSQEVPISVQAYGERTMERLGAARLIDLASSTPSLSIGGVAGSSGTQMGIRGIVDYARNPGTDASMGIYIDGVFQGRSYTANQPLLGIESVEILRGPQGTLFGKNTVSGAINMNTKTPDENFDGELKVEAGSENHTNVGAYFSGALADNLFGAISVGNESRDGFYKNTVLNEDVGDYEQSAVRAKLRYIAADNLEFILAADAADSESGGPVNTGWLEKPFTTNKGLKESDKVKFSGGALTVNYDFENDLTLTSITSARQGEFDNFQIDTYGTYSPNPGLLSYFDEKNDQFSQELRLVSPVSDSFDWVAGVYYFENTSSTKRYVTFTPDALANLPGLPDLSFLSGSVAIPSEVNTQSIAAYAHGNYRFSEEWELTAGLRIMQEDKDVDFQQTNISDLGIPGAPGGFLFGAGDIAPFKDDRSESDVSPTIGLNWRFSEDAMLFTKYTRAFKSGGWNTEFRTANSGLNGIDYDAQSVDNFELGLKSNLLDGGLQLNATAFMGKYDDYQVFQYLPSLQVLNAGEVTTQGVEVETIWVPVERLQLTANVTALDAKYDVYKTPAGADYSGNKLANAPDLKAYLGVQYTQPLGDWGNLAFNVDYTFQDDMYTDARNTDAIYLIESYDLWNLRATLNPNSDSWQVSAWVKNLSDETYPFTRNQSFLGEQRVAWGAPRTYGVTFNYYLGGQ